VYILEELAKEAIERVRYSKDCSKERLRYGKGRNNSDNGRSSRSNYL